MHEAMKSTKNTRFRKETQRSCLIVFTYSTCKRRICAETWPAFPVMQPLPVAIFQELDLLPRYVGCSQCHVHTQQTYY